MEVKLGADHMRVVMGRDEAATIYFALREYSDRLVKDLNAAVGTPDEFEELAFLGGTLSKVNAVLFAMVGDHSPNMRTKIVEWLDV